ncbi:MAG: hypothetical protein CVV44_21795 [Spirochaetae bacterium HGW-Spirochaetae-1]|jgi:predicted AlkP superfamily pyrophosphatase or phosphodiesterase|nr:MAG: hypothetical protein CVV44_21795 [Spirochaetae bacterium HGW-Spirochaetae-1]
MKKTIEIPILVTLFISAVILPGCTPRPASGAPDLFLVVSIDSLRPDALSPERASNISALAKEGKYIEGSSVHPPKTLIAHTAMFTGLTPEESGKKDNSWYEGDEHVKSPTIFTLARSKGLATGYFYSKAKLGYLVNDAVIKHEFSEEYSIDSALDFIRIHKNTFVFLHVSGLEYAGMEYGWMSKEYLNELSSIDRKLMPLFSAISTDGKKYTIIITSDHGGHDKLHGTDHRDDYRVPLVMYSNYKKLPDIKGYRLTDLKGIIEKMI